MKQNNQSSISHNGSLVLGEGNSSITFLKSPRVRAWIPNIVDRAEFSIWVERAADDAPSKRYKTFYEYFGKPNFIPVENISNKQLPAELERLRKMMEERHVRISTYTEVSDRQLYRFITKELFGMLTVGEIVLKPLKLVYEEFHGSDEYEIKKVTSEFLRSIFKMDISEYSWKESLKGVINSAPVKKFIMQYEDFNVDYVEMDAIALQDDTASVIFTTSFYGIINSVFVHHFEGDGKCDLVRSGDSWKVNYVDFPGRVK